MYPSRRVALAVLGAVAVATTATACQTTTTSTSKPKSSAKSVTSSGSNTSAIAHSEDVAINKCYLDDIGYMTADVTITNHSSKSSNYFVTIAFESLDAKTQLATGIASADSVDSGQAAKDSASSLKDGTAGQFKCVLKTVDRLAAN